jgi:hypothetical protein
VAHIRATEPIPWNVGQITRTGSKHKRQNQRNGSKQEVSSPPRAHRNRLVSANIAALSRLVPYHHITDVACLLTGEQLKHLPLVPRGVGELGRDPRKNRKTPLTRGKNGDVCEWSPGATPRHTRMVEAQVAHAHVVASLGGCGWCKVSDSSEVPSQQSLCECCMMQARESS